MAFYIKLCNPNPAVSYQAGDVVEGHLHIQNEKPIKITEISIVLVGIGKVFWTESRTVHVGNTHYTYIHSAEETYVHEKIVLTGNGQNVAEIFGHMTFPFNFVLPNNMPSSFDSETGSVSYSLNGEAKTPMFSFNIRSKLEFEVIGIFDLNIQNGANLSQETHASKGPNWFVCRTGQIEVLMKLPTKTGFVPGEILDPTIEVTNHSNMKILGMRLVLIQNATFHAGGTSRMKSMEFCQTNGPEVGEGEEERWIPNEMVVPLLPPTRLGLEANCRIINIQYLIRLEVTISGLSRYLTAELPVIIGTIPLGASPPYPSFTLEQPMSVPFSLMSVEHGNCFSSCILL